MCVELLNGGLQVEYLVLQLRVLVFVGYYLLVRLLNFYIFTLDLLIQLKQVELRLLVHRLLRPALQARVDLPELLQLEDKLCVEQLLLCNLFLLHLYC